MNISTYLHRFFKPIVIVLLLLSTNLTVSSQVFPKLIIENPDIFYLSDISFSSDGLKLYTGGWKMHVWDIKSGNAIFTYVPDKFKDQSIGIFCIAISPDTKTIFVGGTFLTGSLLDAKTLNVIQTFHGTPGTSDTLVGVPYKAADFSQDGKSILVGDGFGNVYLLDILSGKDRFLTNFGGPYMDTLFHLNDPTKFFVNNRVYSFFSQEKLFYFEGDRGILLNNKKTVLVQGNGSNSHTRSICQYDVDSYKLLKKSSEFELTGNNFAFSPNGKIMIVGANREFKQPTHAIDVETGKIVCEFSSGVDSNLDASKISFSPDSKRMGIVYGNSVSIYDISDLYSSVPQSTNLKQ